MKVFGEIHIVGNASLGHSSEARGAVIPFGTGWTTQTMARKLGENRCKVVAEPGTVKHSVEPFESRLVGGPADSDNDGASSRRGDQ